MSILQSDIKFYLTGAESDGGAQTDPNASLGGYRSSTEIISAQLNNLFDNVGSAESASGDTEYRCVCVKNTALETLYNILTWIQAEVDPDNTYTWSFAIEVPATADLTDGSAQTVVNESTSPSVNTTNHNGTGSGISNWSSATEASSGVSPAQGAHDDDLDQGEIMFIWMQRVVSAGAPARTGLSVTMRVRGDTN